jgi:hypothetical protein
MTDCMALATHGDQWGACSSDGVIDLESVEPVSPVEVVDGLDAWICCVEEDREEPMSEGTAGGLLPKCAVTYPL